MNAPATHLERIASRAELLYSRPSVAMEVVRLTEAPHTDGGALKDCIAQDPALACKVLRVVNSSLFGLNRPVADLNQAIGLLGIKPLKLLVLGFSLPDALFADVAARQLRWYWTNSLTRAVSARLLAERFWRLPGDEAFIAGLLHDIGILVLLRELGQPYARFLAGVIDERCDLAALETETLGFDHVELSSALLARWQLPRKLVEAIAVPKWTQRLVRTEGPETELAEVLHLADLLTQLVGQRRLRVLGELLEAGKLYRGITKRQWAELVKQLQPPVDQLADVLALELTGERDYVQTLLAAHQQMAVVGEQMLSATETGEHAHAQPLHHTEELSAAMRRALHEPPAKRGDGHLAVGQPALFAPGQLRLLHDASPLARALATAATQCRERRQELSLLLVESSRQDAGSKAPCDDAARDVLLALESACAALEQSRVTLVPLDDQRSAAVITNCERPAALAIAKATIAEFHRRHPGGTANGQQSMNLCIGVATAGAVPKNFDATRMIDRAARCVRAARATGNSSVKSIEV